MENKNFDDFIKQSLEHLDGEKYIPMDWSSMNEQLDADGLDEAMKGSLENLEGAAFVPMDWSLMESKLDAELADADIDPQMEDIYLDAVVYDHLNNLQTAYNPQHWEMMSARLDEEYAYRRKLFITKAFEAAIVLLLVWTAINYFPNKTFKSSQKNIENNTHSIQDNTKDLSAILPTPSSTEIPKSENTSILGDDNISDVESTQLAQNSEVGKSKNENESNFLNSNTTDDLSFSSIPTIPQYNANPKVEASPFLSTISSISLLEKNNRPASNNSFDKTLELNDQPLLNKKIHVQIAAIPSLVSSLLEPEESNKYDYSKLFIKKKLRTHEIFFSMYTSADLNFVSSDFYYTNIRAWDVYNRSEFGYGGGFALGFQLNRFLIETGASYNFISYSQQYETNVSGSFFSNYVSEKWEDAELNMVQIPLNIQYSFLIRKKWRMYSLTGVSLNMALQNNFNFQLEELEEGKPVTASRSSSEESEIVNEALLYKGILEGGGLKQNSYLTANLGIGLERKFTYRWSLFLQPIYRHHFLIDGIGPNKDKIHSGSIRFGAKVKIR